ncbi:hypothetical protein PsorP6_007537 [Peronosclerospora sorghi]|uniref:Uncharacterized protein n=1 Tax=Peronosclerospora sorghi TaxID=230839 RepID=A0ACC0W9K2_9STRA|nr:hypothetical protein PsorP6_007537 [Peronosclerospora sorghi]
MRDQPPKRKRRTKAEMEDYREASMEHKSKEKMDERALSREAAEKEKRKSSRPLKRPRWLLLL